jgi:CelD/BcsL family acetyltransferase involved in cellulose biosynthesis
VGLVPLLWDEKGELGCPRCYTLPANLQTTREDILCDGDPAAVLEAAVAHLRGSGLPLRLELPRVREDSAVRRSLARVLADPRLRTVERDEPASPVIRLVDGGWEGYLRSLPRHTRQELQRKRRVAERSGSVAWSVHSAPEEVSGALAAVFNIERRSWKEGAGTSITSAPESERFFAELARLAAAAGSLRIYLLVRNGEPIAHVFCLLHRNELHALKTSYRRDLGQLSPGVVLLGHVLEDAFAHCHAVVDLLGETSRWKNEISNGSREHQSVCLFASDLARCRACRVVEQRVKPLARQHAPRLLSSRQTLTRWLRARRAKRS